MISVEAIDDELLSTAVSPCESEDNALAAVRMLGAAREPNGRALASIVTEGRPSVARLALNNIFDRFGESTEYLDNIVAELKRVITADHPNFDLVKGL